MIEPHVEESGTEERSWAQFSLVMLMAMVLTAAVYATEHSWDASEYISFMTYNFNGAENLTADRLSEANAGSMLARMLLFGCALLGFLIPGRFKLQWRSPVLWIWCAFILWMLATCLWSINPSQTLYKLGVLGIFSLTAMMLPKHFGSDDWVTVLIATCFSLIMLGFVAEISLNTFAPFAAAYRFSGTVHPNTQAIYSTVICLAGSLYFGRGPKQTMWAVCLIGFGVFILLLTKSRTSLAGMVLGFAAVQALRARGAKRVFLVAGAIGGLAVALVAFTLVGARARGSVGEVASMGRMEHTSTLSGRLPLWEHLLVDVGKNPVFGYGYLAYWDAERIEELGDIFSWEIPHGHNSYIDVMLDGGVIALALYLAWMLAAALRGFRVYEQSQNVGAALLFGVVVVAFVNGFGESLFKMPNFHLFILCSLIANTVWGGPAGLSVASDEAGEDEDWMRPNVVRRSKVKVLQ